jgi:hypothetical protein
VLGAIQHYSSHALAIISRSNMPCLFEGEINQLH